MSNLFNYKKFLPTIKNKHRMEFLWIIVCVGGFVIFYCPTNNWSWDPSYYYAQLRSPIIDHDLYFRDETITNGVITKITVTGLQGSPWPVGPSILWSPFFMIAHIFVLMIAPTKASGFSFPYIALVSFGSVLYGIAGLLVVYKSCRHYGNRYISAISILIGLGATPLFFYIFHQPIMAHTSGLLVSALMFLFYIRQTESQWLRNESGLIFGVLLGLCFLMRWAGIIFVVFPITYFIGQIRNSVQTKNYSELQFLIRQMIILIAAFTLTISPQLSLWYRLYGTFLRLPQDTSTFVANVFPINILKIFFDTNRGLLFWSPFFLISMFGIAYIPNSEIKVCSAILVLSHLILIGYRVDWFGGGGYGPRYFIELIPIFAVGFTCLFRNYTNKLVGQLLLAICAICFIAHQSILLYAFEHVSEGWINLAGYSQGQPLGLDWQVKSTIRLIENPRFILDPRPNIKKERQTIIVNIVSGVRKLKAYRITGTGVLLMPIVVIAFSWICKYINRNSIKIIIVILMFYMMIWSVYFLIVN